MSAFVFYRRLKTTTVVPLLKVSTTSQHFSVFILAVQTWNCYQSSHLISQKGQTSSSRLLFYSTKCHPVATDMTLSLHMSQSAGLLCWKDSVLREVIGLSKRGPFVCLLTALYRRKEMLLVYIFSHPYPPTPSPLARQCSELSSKAL